ncbi:Flp pilus assembly protein CpaB [Actinomadura viridis]|uniref:Pilus assembly protein CpaB n=1 Tax=Actinomadura viridis TaxID=58110 RepID=A0A931GHA5_9ACTN|nr:Flp pilus assembly protein CpaB [Actinomadura viridis]MBG6087213.1 pilus assembly protein CpaB [Actinomadura viridis]
MILAAVGAVLVFITVVGYVGKVQADADAAVGEMTTVLQVQSNIEAFQPVSASAVRQTQIPKKWATNAFVTNIADLQGKVAAGSIPSGAYLQQGMLLDAPSLRPGQREIAILIDAETGVAGKVMNGSIVDVYASFDSTQNGRQVTSACAVRILNRVQVINVGQVQQTSDAGGGQQQGGGSRQQTSGAAVPVTFALNSDDTLKLTYAESFARKVRLALVGGAQDAKPPFNRLCETPQAGR